MTRRIDADLFFDEDVVGVELPEDDPIPPGWEVLPEREHPLPRLARHPFSYAGVLFGLGFFTVFVDQAPFLLQVVLGAPIFEEMVKFGLALLLALPLVAVFGGFAAPGRWRHRAWLLLTLPVALAVGVGFGILEHVTSYPDEDGASRLWRISFHAVSTGLSMVTFYAVVAWPDPRVRWFAPLPAVVVHYANNASAVVLTVADAVVPVDGAGLLSSLLVGVAAVLLLAFLIAPATIRGAMGRLATNHLPDRTAPRATAGPGRGADPGGPA